MEDARNGWWASGRASQMLDHRADSLLADASNEPLAHERIDLGHAALVALEELRMEAATGARYRQIVNHAGGGAEGARAVSSALIASLARPLIPSGANELSDLFLFYTLARSRVFSS